MTVVRAGLRLWQEATCIDFVEDGDGDDFLLFIRG